MLSPVLCTARAGVLCARAGGVILLGVTVNCTVYLCTAGGVMLVTVTCCHLYCVLMQMYCALVPME